MYLNGGGWGGGGGRGVNRVINNAGEHFRQAKE